MVYFNKSALDDIEQIFIGLLDWHYHTTLKRSMKYIKNMVNTYSDTTEIKEHNGISYTIKQVKTSISIKLSAII